MESSLPAVSSEDCEPRARGITSLVLRVKLLFRRFPPRRTFGALLVLLSLPMLWCEELEEPLRLRWW